MRSLLVTIAAVSVLAAEPARAEWLLAATYTRAVGGKPFQVSVVRDEADATGPMPERLEAVLEAGDRRAGVVLVRAPEGGSLHRQDYLFDWPEDLTGVAVLRLTDRRSSRLMLGGEPAVPITVGEAVAQAAVAPEAELPRREPALTFHEPMYFLVGANGGTNARFQLSFRYRLFDVEGAVVDYLPFLGGLNFAYTQTSLWDLAHDSKPFRDTSYRPSLFYQWDFADLASERDRLVLQTGYEHESNGRDSTASRSIDMLFVRADWRFRLGDGSTYVGVAPKVWYYLDREQNPRIANYRGHGELGLRLGRDDGWLGTLRLRRTQGGIGSTQVDLSYPLGRSILADVGAFFHLQYFDGYGETLLDYDVSRHPQLRVGFSILR